jgi:hypothetical protein
MVVNAGDGNMAQRAPGDVRDETLLLAPRLVAAVFARHTARPAAGASAIGAE